MFGYVMANQDGLSVEAKERYRAAYCGLCHALGRRHGSFSKLTLNYDLTFLALFLTALYEENTETKEGRCGLHPFKKHKYCYNDAVDYAADMNIALSYYNFLDNWQDDKSVISRAEAGILRKECARVEEQYPRQCNAIKESLQVLGKMEKDNVLNPDLPAACFGRLMAEIFVKTEDEFALNLRKFGFALGKFVYLLDAMVDLKKDIKKEKYNPLITFPADMFRDSLCLLMNDCTLAFGEFDNLQKDELLLNILYSGVWIKFELYQAKENKKTEKTLKKKEKNKRKNI